MKLSTKGRYGVKAMVDLAVNYEKEPISIKSISERQKISEYYLEQLFSPLRKKGIIKSVRGAQGGYVLGKNPKDISIYEIITVLEGPIEISDCIESESCANIDCCATRSLWVRIKNSIDDVTKNTTLYDLVEENNKINNRGENHG